MTHAEFFARARAKGPWRVNRNGMVRNKDGCCPLGAVMMGNRRVPPPDRAAGALKIPFLVTSRIANGADRPGSSWRPPLLRDLGMTP